MAFRLVWGGVSLRYKLFLGVYGILLVFLCFMSVVRVEDDIRSLSRLMVFKIRVEIFESIVKLF